MSDEVRTAGTNTSATHSECRWHSASPKADDSCAFFCIRQAVALATNSWLFVWIRG